VVLASGDPNLYGITGYLLNHFGKEAITITPAVSSMQWAFALAREPWGDAEIVSAHGRGQDEVIRAVLMRDTVGVFTDDRNSPAALASALISQGVGERKVYVCENIGTGMAKVTECSLGETVNKKFSPMNVMIIKKEKREAGDDAPPHKNLGIPDYQLAHRDGLITKAEVRAISLCKLRPLRGSVMWDIGAGCGAVSIEAENMVAPGKVFAIEKDAKQVVFLKKNIEKFACHGVEPIEGSAPDILKGLPDPDAVFIGGSGGHLREILAYVDGRLKPGGRVVANVVALENFAEVFEFMKDYGYAYEITTAAVSRSKDLAGKHFMVAGNPVNVILGIKK
jgi:precorrin-6Y C5,15-methyltransferase (decarboxylating)